MTALISRDQVINRIREAGWQFTDQTKRVELYKRKGSTDRMVVPKRDNFPVDFVRMLLRQAGLTPNEIDGFVKHAVKH